MHTKNLFARFATYTSHLAGHPITFTLACVTVIIWGLTGPIFHFSDTWQLIVNTLTNIIAFLVIFLIQNTQTRDTEALQIKIDELIRSIKPARNALLDIEELDEKEIEAIKKHYEQLAKKARNNKKL